MAIHLELTPRLPDPLDPRSAVYAARARLDIALLRMETPALDATGAIQDAIDYLNKALDLAGKWGER